MKSIGIDIGSSSIKILEVFLGKKGPVIYKFSEHPLGSNPAFDPEIEILEILRSSFPNYDPATTRFCVGLRQDFVSSRFWTFPFIDRTKILKLLPHELEDELPFSVESAIYDFKTIKTIVSSSQILALAAPKHRIESTLNIFRTAGIDPMILSCEALALANCFEKETLPPHLEKDVSIEKNLTLTVYIGHSRTQVLTFEQNRLINVRTLLWGTKNIAEAIALRYEIPFIEALNEMKTKAFILLNKESASYDQIVFSDTISNQIKELVQDLKITLLELNSTFNGAIQEITISGGGSSILNFNAYLTQQLEIPVNKTQVLRNFSNLQIEKTPYIESVIGVALGLALEGLKKPRNPAVNFLKGEFALQNLGFRKFLDKWVPLIQLGAAALIIFFIYATIRDTVTVDLSERTEEVLKNQAKTVAKLGPKQTNPKGIKTYISSQQKRSTDLKNMTNVSKMNSALDVLKKINDASPAKSAVKLDIKKLAIEDDQVKIEGSVLNSQQVSLLKNALTNIALSGKIETLNPTITTPTGSTAFAFSFKIDRGIKQ